MVDRETLTYLRLAHGSFNTIICFFLAHQGWLGYGIRKARLAGVHSGTLNKRHRKNGPYLTMLGIMGFLVGMTLGYIDHGCIVKYALHFTNGGLIAIALIGMFFISRKIRATETQWRTVHYRLGIITLFLYFFQLLLGLDILL